MFLHSQNFPWSSFLPYQLEKEKTLLKYLGLSKFTYLALVYNEFETLYFLCLT